MYCKPGGPLGMTPHGLNHHGIFKKGISNLFELKCVIQVANCFQTAYIVYVILAIMQTREKEKESVNVAVQRAHC